jgi:hypothetical protein
MTDEKPKDYRTEWSFSFSNIGESISGLLESLGAGQDQEVQTASFVEPLDSAEAAEVTLEPTVGAASISALADSDNLLEAEVAYFGEIRFASETHSGRKLVRLGQTTRHDSFKPVRDAIGSFARQKELYWHMRLTPNIPLDLRINSGVTQNDFDLSGLQLTELRFIGGTGKTDLRLPTMGGGYDVTLTSGTGELNVTIPDGAHINLRATNGTGATRIRIGANTSIDARITGGIGQCVIELPPDVGVRIKASSGLGKVRVPSHYIALKVDEFIATSGTWESPGYDQAENRVTIKYEGGIGGLTIQQ